MALPGFGCVLLMKHAGACVDLCAPSALASKARYYWTVITLCAHNSLLSASDRRKLSFERKDFPAMNKLFKSLLCLVLFVAALGAKDKDKKSPAASGLPPIIDRELIFGNPEIAAAELSPDGKYLAFLKPWKDTRNVYVKGVDEPFSAARLLTTETKRPIAGFF